MTETAVPDDLMKVAREVSRICYLDGCDSPHHARGLCKIHYLRKSRYGDPYAKTRPGNGEARRYFLDVVLTYDGDECLVWPFFRDPQGYGRVSGQLVTRAACQMLYGDPPTPKHEAAHSCGKGHEGCCTPRHLSWKTRLENEADKETHGTKAIGQRNGQSRLTDANVQEIRSLKGVISQQEIGKRFGVSQSHVNDILNHRNWTHLDPSP